MSSSSLGAWGEARAREHLLAQGFTLHASNWRCRDGELDLVAEEAVSARKVRHLVQAALAYLDAHQLTDRDWRIDVIAITASRGPRLVRLEHFVDAVRA